MARIRTVKPEFWSHEDLSDLPSDTHMLAAALLNHADDEGFFNANARLVKAQCVPLREDSVSVHDSLIMLSDAGFIRLGDGSDGKRYGHIVKFLDHQRINRPTPSKISGITVTWHDSLSPHTQLTESSLPEGKGREGKGKERKHPCPPSGDGGGDEPKRDLKEEAFELFWSSGLAKTNKRKARTTFKRICGTDPQAFAEQLHDDVKARLAAGQLGFDRMHPTTYLNGERWNDEIISGTTQERRLSPAEEVERAIAEQNRNRGRGGPVGLAEDDGDVRGSMDEGEGDGSTYDMESGAWETGARVHQTGNGQGRH